MDLKRWLASFARVFAALAYLGCAGLAQADSRFQALWENYERAQGLPSGQVASFAQDARGYLYAGTDRGLTRFDGRSFAILKTEPALPLEAVEFLRFDEHGKLWATVNGFGVCVIDQLNLPIARSRCLSETAQEPSHRLPDNQVFTLESWRGRMWLAIFGHGLLEVELDSLATGMLHPFPDNRLLSSAIWQDALLLGALGGALYRFEPTLGIEKIADLGEAANLIAADGARVFITLLRGNALLEINSALQLTRHAITGAKAISSFSLHQNSLVLATDSGLFLGHPERDWLRLKSFGSAIGAMPEGRINTVFFDAQNGLWVGSKSAGAGRLNDINSPLTWLLRGDGGLPTNTVNAADLADDGRLWVATASRGVLAFYPDGTMTSLPTDAQDGVPIKNTRAVRTAGETLWIGHHSGLTKLLVNAQRRRFVHWKPSGEITSVDQIEPMPDGGAWVSAGFSQLVRLDSALNPIDRIQAPGESTVIEQFIVSVNANQETLWWADDAGFHVRAPKQAIQTLSTTQGFGVAHCKKSARIWFFGRAGLIAVDLKTRQIVQQRSHLTEASSDVGGLWCDNADTLYFSGNSGLWRWMMESARPERLDTLENAAEMSERPLQAVDNALLVAGPRGLLRVDLDKLASTDANAATLPFALHITDAPPSVLRWQENAAMISADALSLHSPQLTQFEFVAKSGTQLLESSGWINSHQHRFERLPAGNIRFEVAAKNAVGLRVLAKRIVSDVEQVPWRRPLALALMFGLSAALIYALHRGRLARHKREAQLRESELHANQKTELAFARTESMSLIAHEMRNLLNGVGTSAELMRRHPDSDQVPQWLNRVESASESLGRLLDDALDFTKIATGHIEIQARSTDVVQLINDCVESQRARAEDKSLLLQAHFAVDSPVRMIDPVRIRQIASNLINNAIKFTDQGSVRVRLTEVAESASSALVLEVEDSGIGIPMQDRARIFEPYARLNTERHGTGLGLAITAALAKACDGLIVVLTPTAGSGSLFRLTIPGPLGQPDFSENQALPPAFDSIALEALAEANSANADATPRETLLLVEDDLESLQTLSALMQSYGYSCICCSSAFDALIAAQSTGFAAVLLDLALSDMDGFEFAETLRMMPNFAQLPMIALSGFSDDATRARALRAGINELQVKPYRGELIHAALLKHLPVII